MSAPLFPATVEDRIERMAEEAHAELAVMVNRARRSLSQIHRRHREARELARVLFEHGRFR